MPRAPIHKGSPRPPRALLLLPLAALLALAPLLHGVSCGQDQLFHLQSWLDAASQLRHGHYPTWAVSPAFNAGEPRFLFYPPLSWLLGALLVTLTSALRLPTEAAPILFTFLALTSAGLAFHRLARAFTGTSAALLSAALYLANPYMLYNAFERSAYAELLAATWIPLLLLAVLRPRPTSAATIRAIAIPLALLWLTNAPAAVMGSYTFALLATLRVFSALRDKSATRSRSTALRLALTYLAGTALGLALPAFYLIPAAVQRRYVQVAMAIIPNMRFQDNFLFTATSDAPHNAVNRTASYLALALLAATVLTLSAYFLRSKSRTPQISVILSEGSRSLTREPQPKDPEASTLAQADRTFPTTTAPASTLAPHFLQSRSRRNAVILSEGSRGLMREPQPKDPEASSLAQADRTFPTTIAPTLALLTLLIAFLLVPLSTPIWLHLPELAFLQFPWRLLTILSPILCLSLALLLNQSGAPFMTRHHRGMSGIATALTLLLPLALGAFAYRLYAQGCAASDRPSVAAANFASGHGVGPTDEYTPNDADNDLLRPNNPALWLLPATADPNTPAPHTIPNPASLTGDYDTPLLPSQTLSTPAPHHFTITTPQPSILVLNLRAYPNWDITTGCPTCIVYIHYPHLQRDDGLLAIALPATTATIDIHWHRSPDQDLGLATSLLALLLLTLTFRKPSPSSLPPS